MTNTGPRRENQGRPATSGIRSAFDTVDKCLVIFGVMSVVVLGTLAVAALTGGSVNTFMWVRASLLVLIVPIFRRMAGRAGRGEARSFDRLRTVATVLPVAIVVVDLIPGVCPVWYASMQGASVVPLIAIAIMTRRLPLRAALNRRASNT